MKQLVKNALRPALQAFYHWYFSTPRRYRYQHVRVIVLPGIFAPHLTLSTKVLLQFMDRLELKDKSLLELGCGCGILSVFAASKGARVTSSDINPMAIENVEFNAKKNTVELQTVVSDLFDNLPSRVFDFLFINPPYYPKSPKTMAEKAWLCGKDFDYFTRLFQQLSDIPTKTKIYMVLSEDCEIHHLIKLAKHANLNLDLVKTVSHFWERNFIYQLNQKPH
jgi:release factor glutamine methyltransferase